MRHLKLYRAMRAIHRTGSIRRAAETSSVSPSALNRSIQAFEDEIGTPVFERLPGGVRLTSAGELLFNLSERHLTEFEELQRQMRGLAEGVSGVIRLSLGEDLGAGLLLDVIAGFETAFPGVSVEILSDNTPERLKRRAVDLAILTAPATDDSVEVLFSHPVGITAFVAVDGPRPGGIWDLLDHRLVVPPDGTGTRIAFSHLMRRHRLSEPTITVAPVAQMAQMLGAPGRACIAPSIAFDAGAAAHSVRAMPLSRTQSHLSVLRGAGVPMTRPTEALSSHLQTALNRLEG